MSRASKQAKRGVGSSAADPPLPMPLPGLPPLLPVAGAAAGAGRGLPLPFPVAPVAMHRPAAAAAAAPVEAPIGGRIVVMDNGGNTCKIGLAGQPGAPKLVPNCGTKPKRERRLFVGDQIDTLIDFTNLNYRRPMERGYVTNWELQTLVWDRCFTAKPNGLCVNPRACSLLVTEPPFNLAGIRGKMDEIVFEKYGFQTYCRMQSAGLAARGVQREPGRERVAKPCGVVVDSGYSFTHVTPLFDGQPLNYAVKRVDVGGKLLTNLLKEVVSYRAFNVMDETHLLNAIKERLCFVSLDYTKDLATTKSLNPKRNPIKREYVFPNGTTRVVGYVKGEDNKDGTRKKPAAAGATAAAATAGKPSGAAAAAAAAAAATKGGAAAASVAAAMEDDRRQLLHAAEEDDEAEEQVLVMNGERISVPEVLFHPADIGMRQGGVAEAIAQSIAAVPRALQPLMYGNVVLCGGNTLLPNYAQRVEQELRALAPAEYPVHVVASADPVTACWRGAAHWAATDTEGLLKHSVSKADWDELGPELCSRMFYS